MSPFRLRCNGFFPAKSRPLSDNLSRTGQIGVFATIFACNGPHFCGISRILCGILARLVRIASAGLFKRSFSEEATLQVLSYRRQCSRLLGLLCGSAIWFGLVSAGRADFTGAVQLHVYPFNQGPLNATFPLDAEFVPGPNKNLMGIAGKYGAIDILNTTAGGTPKRLLQLDIEFYPVLNEPNEPVGIYLDHGETGTMGLAFHPNFWNTSGTGAGKLYVNATVDNIVDPNSPFIPGVIATDGLSTQDMIDINTKLVDPMVPNSQRYLDRCYICETGYGKPMAELGDDFVMRFNCDSRPNPNVPFKAAVATFPTFTQIREYTVNRNGSDDPANWTVNDDDYNTVMQFPRPREWHNGGWVEFGPDGMLYISSGDSEGRPSEQLTHPGSPSADFYDASDQAAFNYYGTPAAGFYGKVLRVDVNNDDFLADDSKNYAIPDDNPFANNTPSDDDETYVYGLRNPWRADFDAQTGDLWIGDTGFNRAEEVNRSPGAGNGGENFGWPYYEGNEADGPTELTVGAPPFSETVAPEYRYLHESNSPPGKGRAAIIGGVLYRGADPSLNGKYIYYESNRREFWSYDPNEPNPALRAKDISHTIFDDLDSNGEADRTLKEGDLIPRINGTDVGVIASLAEDANGNMYAVDVFQLRAYRITSADINFDGRIDDVDIDLLATEANKSPGLQDKRLDLDNDGSLEFVVNSSGTASDSDLLVRTLVEVRDANDVLIGHGTQYGDLNLNGRVSAGDLDVLLQNYRKSGLFGWKDGNINGSQQAGTVEAPRITAGDLDVLLLNYRFQTGNGAFVTGLVPEPTGATLALYGICVLICLKFCKRNRFN